MHVRDMDSYAIVRIYRFNKSLDNMKYEFQILVMKSSPKYQKMANKKL